MPETYRFANDDEWLRAILSELKRKSDSQPHPADDWTGTALRVAPGVAGGLVGMVGGPWGAAIGGGLGSALGESMYQLRRRTLDPTKKINVPGIAVQGALGAVVGPSGKFAQGLRPAARLAAQTGIGAGMGAALGGPGAVATNITERHNEGLTWEESLPTWEQAKRELAFGGGVGALSGGAIGGTVEAGMQGLQRLRGPAAPAPRPADWTPQSRLDPSSMDLESLVDQALRTTPPPATPAAPVYDLYQQPDGTWRKRWISPVPEPPAPPPPPPVETGPYPSFGFDETGQLAPVAPDRAPLPTITEQPPTIGERSAFAELERLLGAGTDPDLIRFRADTGRGTMLPEINEPLRLQRRKAEAAARRAEEAQIAAEAKAKAKAEAEAAEAARQAELAAAREAEQARFSGGPYEPNLEIQGLDPAILEQAGIPPGSIQGWRMRVLQSGPEWTRIESGGDRGARGGVYDVPTAALRVQSAEERAALAAERVASEQRAFARQAVLKKPISSITPEEWWNVLTEADRAGRIRSITNFTARDNFYARMGGVRDSDRPANLRPAAPEPTEAPAARQEAPPAAGEEFPPDADAFAPEMFEAPAGRTAPQGAEPEGLIPMLLRLEAEGQIPPETLDLARSLRDLQAPGVQPARLTARLAGAGAEIPAMQAFQPGQGAPRPVPVERRLGPAPTPELDLSPTTAPPPPPRTPRQRTLTPLESVTATRAARIPEMAEAPPVAPDLERLLTPEPPPVDVGAPPRPVPRQTPPTVEQIDAIARSLQQGGLTSVSLPDVWDAYRARLAAQGIEADPAAFQLTLQQMKRRGGRFAPPDSPRQMPPEGPTYLPRRAQDAAGQPDYDFYYYPPEGEAPTASAPTPPREGVSAVSLPPWSRTPQIPANLRSFLSRQLGYSQREINDLSIEEATRLGREQVRRVRAPEEFVAAEEGGVGEFVAPPSADYVMVRLTRQETQANPALAAALKDAGFRPPRQKRPDEWYLNTVDTAGREIMSQEEGAALARRILNSGEATPPRQTGEPPATLEQMLEPVAPDTQQAADEIGRMLETSEIGPGLAARQARAVAGRGERMERLQATRVKPTQEPAPELAYVPPAVRKRAAQALKASEEATPRPPKEAPVPASRATGELGWAFNVLDDKIGPEVMFLKEQGDFAAVLPPEMIGRMTGPDIRRMNDDYFRAMSVIEEAARKGNPEALYYFSAHEQTAAARFGEMVKNKGFGKEIPPPETRTVGKQDAPTKWTAFSGADPGTMIDTLVEKMMGRQPEFAQEIARRIGYAFTGGFAGGVYAGYGADPEDRWKYVLAGMAAGGASKDLVRLARAAGTAARTGAGKLVEMRPPRVPKKPKAPERTMPPSELPAVFKPKAGKDLNWLEDFFGTVQRNLPEYGQELDLAERAFNKERSLPSFKGTSEELRALTNKHYGKLIATLRRDAKNIRSSQPWKARYMNALASDLADMSDLPVSRGLKTASRLATATTYRMLVGWGVDTAAQNLTQPILALSHVPPKFLKRGFNALASEAMEAGLRGKGKSWEQSQVVHLDRPLELSTEVAQKGVRLKSQNLQKALDFWNKYDPMVFLRSTDSWNRRGVFLGAMEYALSKGQTDDAAMKWALDVVYKTQGATGRLGSNPHWRGPLISLLRPFLKFPTMFTEHMVDMLTAKNNLAGQARLFGTIGGLIAASELAYSIGLPSISTENLLVSGGRPLGFDIAHPLRSAQRIYGEQAGETFPVVRGGKRVLEIAQGRSETPITGDVAQFVFGRYPVKLVETLTEMQGQAGKGNLWGTHTARSGSGAAVPHTGIEDVMNLLGMKSVRQVKLREAYDDLQDVTATELAARQRDLSAIKQRVLTAMDRGDFETARREAATLTKRQRRALISGANRTRFERRLSGMPKEMQRKIREDFGERFRKLERQEGR